MFNISQINLHMPLYCCISCLSYDHHFDLWECCFMEIVLLSGNCDYDLAPGKLTWSTSLWPWSTQGPLGLASSAIQSTLAACVGLSQPLVSWWLSWSIILWVWDKPLHNIHHCVWLEHAWMFMCHVWWPGHTCTCTGTSTRGWQPNLNDQLMGHMCGLTGVTG